MTTNNNLNNVEPEITHAQWEEEYLGSKEYYLLCLQEDIDKAEAFLTTLNPDSDTHDAQCEYIGELHAEFYDILNSEY